MHAYVCLNDYNSEAVNTIKSLGISVTVRSTADRPSEAELCELVNKYEILFIGVKEKMTKEIYECSSRLKIIVTLSIGLDHIDDCFVSDPNIVILNCRLSNVVSVAEHTFALMLALLKKLKKADTACRNLGGRQALNGLPIDLCKKTIGVVGVGNIGQKVIKISKCFDTKVVAWTKNPSLHQDLANDGVEFVKLEKLAATSDIITIHLPLNNETLNLISSDVLNSMKSNAIIVNTSRMGIVDNSSLAQFLREGKFMGVGLDLDTEDVENISLFSEIENVIMTPHIAGLTKDSINKMDTDAVTALQLHLSSRG